MGFVSAVFSRAELEAPGINATGPGAVSVTRNGNRQGSFPDMEKGSPANQDRAATGGVRTGTALLVEPGREIPAYGASLFTTSIRSM